MFIPSKKRKDLGIPIVVDFGSLSVRAGYAGTDYPQKIIPTDQVLNQKNELQHLDWYMEKAPENSEIFKIQEHGQIKDWEAYREVLLLITKTQLGCRIEETPLMLVEPTFITREQRLKIVDLVFEECGFHSFFMHKGPVLSSYIFARDNILILDSGADGTIAVPIYEGFINQKAMMRSEIGGEYLTNKFLEFLMGKELTVNSHFKNQETCSSSLKKWGQLEVLREIKHNKMKVMEFKDEQAKFNPLVDNVVVDLPDKSRIELSREIYDIPELLFKEIPEHKFQGLPHLIKQAIEKVDLEQRRDLFQNIAIVGGNSMLGSFMERIQREMYEIDIQVGQNVRPKAYSPMQQSDKTISSWLGASIVSSMGTFDQLLMTKKDYEEHGSILIERKIFQ